MTTPTGSATSAPPLAPTEVPSGSDDAAVQAAACLFNGFSDRSRLMIVEQLARGDQRVVDLTGHVGLAQSTVSKHLACLLDCGLVTVNPQGRASVYSLAHPHETRVLLAAAQQLLQLTGATVTRCPSYGEQAR